MTEIVKLKRNDKKGNGFFRNKSLLRIFCVNFILLGAIIGMTSQAIASELVQWTLDDFYSLPGIVDDNPNSESRKIEEKYFIPLLKDKVFNGKKGVLKFKILPRSKDWFGIMVLDKDGSPRKLPEKKEAITVLLVDPSTGKSENKTEGLWGETSAHNWKQIGTQYLFCEATHVYWPETTIQVVQGHGKKREVIDEVTVDFSKFKFQKSQIQMQSLLDGPITDNDFITIKDGEFIRNGNPIYFWGGHENGIPSKAQTDFYCEVFSDTGLNLMRHMGLEQMVADLKTGELNKEKLDDYHYFMYKLGKKGIYLMASFTFEYCQVYAKGVFGYSKDDFKTFEDDGVNLWLDPKLHSSWEKFLRNFLTSVNPYTGKMVKDDPTLMGIELANETGLNFRRFDFNNLTKPKSTKIWREAFNKFLLKKYGSRQALADAWQKEPLRSWEDPAKNTILIPTNYRGGRSPYGGTGQHDQFTTGRFYKNGLPVSANPRILDAIEFNKEYGPKDPDSNFDYNNPTRPKETEEWRKKWNAFLLKKYGNRNNLYQAWKEAPVFPGEDPAKNTILIPSDYHGEKKYEMAKKRIASPRISDAIEFTYQVQKDLATDMVNFLRNKVGVKCGIGWNCDSFQVYQTPCHQANMDAPLDIAIHAVYRDWDQGDQENSRLKNLKRFNTYGRIYNRPSLSYEWSAWYRATPYPYDYVLLVALMARVYGFDAFGHHKMQAFKYPTSDPIASMINYINPLLDKRRGAFQVASWILKKSKIPESNKKIIVGYPHNSALLGGPVRIMSNPVFENWLQYQLGSEDYSFNEVYDGPEDNIVIHSGQGPYGDYRKTKHAILWCHSDSDREGKDPDAKRKWFALHGIKFKPGQKYYLDDHYFATTEDMTDYNVVHKKAEENRWEQLAEHQKKFTEASKGKKYASHIIRGVSRADDSYWKPEENQKITELDHQLYKALERWGYPLPFEEKEIDKTWRSLDKTMEMNTQELSFSVDRNDLQVWFGQLAENDGKINMSKLAVESDEPHYSCALIPWDTADFDTAKTLVFWTIWNSKVTVKLPFAKKPEIFAVNWLGERLFKVNPVSCTKNSITFMTARSNDIFCYEIVR